MLDVSTGSLSLTLRAPFGDSFLQCCLDCAAFHRKMEFLAAVEVQGTG